MTEKQFQQSVLDDIRRMIARNAVLNMSREICWMCGGTGRGIVDHTCVQCGGAGIIYTEART